MAETSTEKNFANIQVAYVSVFAEEVAPCASVIVNGLYWKPGYPKLLTTSDAQKLLQARPKTKSDSHSGFDLPHRLLAICEISADPCGAFEFIDKCTTIKFPLFIYDENQQQRDVAYRGPGILIGYARLTTCLLNLPWKLQKALGNFYYPIWIIF
ncbi:hypothetical protein JTE90_010337 [Oedothorax gibbosus]|uniref:Uncharacterized protein n=1 Tax=Oedothorax gibbosus TaxID=931172 RepID=A0AAV6TKU3_9ARAC|nr:hypothetical protein JTE90_010337 [Oedothorax gibbosus]